MSYLHSTKKLHLKTIKTVYPDFGAWIGVFRCLWFSYTLDLPYLREWVLQTIEQAATRKGLDYE